MITLPTIESLRERLKGFCESGQHIAANGKPNPICAKQIFSRRGVNIVGQSKKIEEPL